MNEKANGQEGPIDKKDTIRRFNRWVFERLDSLPPKLLEANARLRIANTAKKDIEEVGRMKVDDYQARFKEVMGKLNQRKFKEGEVLKSDERHDSVTGEPFFARIRKDGDFYVAEEIGEEGKVISQSRISEDGQTQLTLRFRSDRYEMTGANPGINREASFPRAALATFELLVETFDKR